MNIVRSFARVWLALALLLAGCALATAQTAGKTGNPASGQASQTSAESAEKPAVERELVVAALPAGIQEAAGKARRVATDIIKTLEDLKVRLANPSLPANELAKAREELEAVRERAKLADIELSSPLTQMEAQLSRLGPAPKDGETEAAPVAAQRVQLEEVRGVLLGARAQLALAAGVADQLASQAGQIERTRYFDRLFKREQSVLSPALWSQGIKSVSDIWARSARLASGYYTLIADNNGAWVAWFLLAGFVVLSAAGLQLCRMLAHRVRADNVPSGELGKLFRVVAVPIGYGLVAVDCHHGFRPAAV